MGWADVIKSFLHLLTPQNCPGCDLALRPGEDGVCGACAPLIEEVPESLQPPVSSASVFVYGGPLADAICRLKYGGRTEFAPVLGKLLCAKTLFYAGRVDVVIPMPLHPRKLRKRGFNQAVLLAKPVAHNLAARLDVDTLRRVRDTAEQAGLSRQERIRNVQGAFRARQSRRPGRVLLIDDVRTSGATMASAAQALQDAGFHAVSTLALARATP